jgi:3'(2'), 5'-bisphosphate nucleotidase
MVDPIDGTRDFIRGRDGFAVMIGLCVQARPVLGVVYQPTAARLYWATVDGGAWLAEGGGARRLLRVSEVREPSRIRLVASRSHRTPVIDEVRRILQIEDELNIGSVGLKLGLIACGERDLYVNPSSHSSAWDTCAPEAILAAAGGRLTDLEGHPLRYDAEDVRNRKGLIASNGVLHAAVIERLAPLFAAAGALED